MNLREQFEKEVGIDLSDTEIAGKFPYFKNSKWGTIERGQAWKMFAEWLESRLQSQPVTNCNGFNEEQLKDIFFTGVVTGWINDGVIDAKLEEFKEKKWDEYKSRHPELFKPKVIDWDALMTRFAKRHGYYVINSDSMVVFKWLKSQPEFNTAPAEKGREG